jgi:hypothetical protein
MYKRMSRGHEVEGGARYKRAVRFVEATAAAIDKAKGKPGVASLQDLKVLIRVECKREKILREFAPTDVEINHAANKARSVLYGRVGQ